MKLKKSYLLPALCMLLIFLSCKKELNPDDVNPPPLPAGTQNVQVELPAGSSYDLTGAQLMSFGQIFPVSADGKTNAQDLGKFPHIVYVFDKEDNPVLAGFITDSTTTVSAETTAKVLLYHAFGIAYRPDTVVQVFINRIHELPPTGAWITEFSGLWKSDPQILSKGSFAGPLRKTMEALQTERNPVDVGKRTADISVDESDFLSGIQLSQEELGKLTFANTYRRRAHAFLYKMKYKDLDGNEHKVLNDINSNTAADKDLGIDAASANTSLTGQLGTMIEGKADDIFMAKTDPLNLDLAELESEATWKVRIVGPGVPFSKQPVTNAEIAKQTRLELETFAIDFMLPVMMEVMGWKDQLGKSGIKIGDGPLEKFIDATDIFIKASPDVYEEIKNGDYRQAILKATASLWQNTVDKEFENLVIAVASLGTQMIVLSGGNAPGVINDDFAPKVKKGAAILKVVNAAMLGFDFIRIAYGVSNSHQLEEWEVKARSSQVRLNPQESKIVPLAQQKITAEIKNLEEHGGDTHPFFEWSTSGKYGYLKDTKGNQGASFESADVDVFYNCNASAAALSDGDNWEYIYVKAIIGSKVIGTDTAKINVRKFKYRILPNGITLSGKEGANNEVRLYLQRQDGVVDIKPNAQVDYKVIWTTTGKHGGLSAKDIDNAKTITVYNDNAIWYNCLDEDTEEGQETVKARIYSKGKDETSYRLFDEVTGTVNINNDGRKRIIHIPLTFLKGAWKEGNWYTHPVAVVPLDDEAKKYSTKFYNFTGTSKNPPEGSTYTWDAGKRPPTTYSTYPETNDISGNSYYVSLGRTWCSGSPSSCNAGIADTWEARYKELYGSRVMVEVTYYY